jgi:tetratricopeptide (TPR) repeat protein
MKMHSMVATLRDTTSNLGQQALLCCAGAKDREEAGEFEEARFALSEFWQRIGEEPRLEGLDEQVQGDVLLRAGSLTGWIGNAQQISGAQEIAKDLITRSTTIFENSGLTERVAETRVDLAICYWREGAVDEARVTLQAVIEQLEQLQLFESEQRLRALLNLGIVEAVSNHYEDALRIHSQAASLFANSNNHALRGKFHNEFAAVLNHIGLGNSKGDYIDRALLEYAAASFHLEQAGHKRNLVAVENNLGFLFAHLERFESAYEHLNRARFLATTLKDKSLVAQVDDTRARALIAQGYFSKAEKIARASVKVLQEGDAQSLLAETLTTFGTALARLGNFSKARLALEKAMTTAQNAGDSGNEGLAALSLAEELKNHLPYAELFAYYRRAEAELANTHNPEIQNRLGKCARRILTVQPLPDSNEVNNAVATANATAHSQLSPTVSREASLDEQVLRYEAEVIKRALEIAEGSVTRAARLLGVTHQGLAFILNGRQKDLLPSRKPAKPRRRSIIRYH